jgi:hypothetical protein
VSNKVYRLQVQEVCAGGAPAEDPSFFTVKVMQIPAEAPHDLKLLSLAGFEFLPVHWMPNENRGDCIFRAWDVQLREATTTGMAWVAATCLDPPTLRDSTTCNIESLQPSTPYDIRVREVCEDSSTDSAYGYSAMTLWTQPGIWKVSIGLSYTVSATLDAGYAVHRCYVENECCSDEFSLCYAGDQKQMVTVMRADAPNPWGQRPWLVCKSLSMSHLVQEQLVPAESPSNMFCHFAELHSFKASYTLGKGIGNCSCARPKIQFRVGSIEVNFGKMTSAGPWIDASTSECNDMTRRECQIENLEPDTLYEGRSKVRCQEEEL